jgi:hypothetical protein
MYNPIKKKQKKPIYLIGFFYNCGLDASFNQTMILCMHRTVHSVLDSVLFT